MVQIEYGREINAITFFQTWLSNKEPLPIGSKFLIKEQNKTIILIASEGCPKGRFVYETGEEFDIAKNVECKFVQIIKKEEKEDTYYAEDIWDQFDAVKNGKKKIVDGKEEYIPFEITDETKPLILKSFGEEQKNENFHEFVYYDVTKIIDSLLKDKEGKLPENSDEIKYIIKYLNDNYFPVFTKEKLYILFANCTFENTKYANILKIKRKDEDIGYLVVESGRFMFAPKNKNYGDEYSYEEDQTTGFYYTADNYMDIALTAIKTDQERFVNRVNNNPDRNKEDYGYNSSATIKSLLAFSCECYLKSLLLNDGKKINELKDLGHGLVMLFTALNKELMAKIFDYMQRNGYALNDPLYIPTFDANDLTDKFILDLTKDNDAFAELRYSAENNKNTDYTFLYQFAVALRYCSRKEYMFSSPFGEDIDNKLAK